MMATQSEAIQLMTVKEVAAMLRIEPATVYSLINRRQIPSVKIGKSRRFEYSAIADYISRNRQEAAA